MYTFNPRGDVVNFMNYKSVHRGQLITVTKPTPIKLANGESAGLRSYIPNWDATYDGIRKSFKRKKANPIISPKKCTLMC